MMVLGAIYAYCLNGGIGYKGRLPWRHEDDIKHFWETIGQKPVICGSKTWKSAKSYFRKHRPDALHIVISRNAKNRNDALAGRVEFVSTKEDALKLVEENGGVAWICGGKSIYSLFENDVDLFVGSKIFDSYNCDTFLPWMWNDDIPPNARHIWRQFFDHKAFQVDACVDYYVSGRALFSEDLPERLVALDMDWLAGRSDLWH